MEAFIQKMMVNDLIPIFVVMLLGYFSGKKNFFAPTQAQVFNKLVLNYALPAALFTSIVRADRSMLFENATLTIIALVGLVSLFLVSYFSMMFFFKRTKAEAAVCALIAGSPTIGFLGYAILDPLFGTGVETGLVVAIVAIVVNAITLPLGLYLMNTGAPAKTADGKKEKSALMSAIEQPVVWAPLLAVALVLIGIKVPASFDPSFKLLAQANSSVAVFAAGLTLSAYKIELDREVAYNTFFKLVLMPGVFLLAGWACHLSSTILQMLVLAVALPPAFSGIIISSRYQVYTRTGTSTLATSVIGFIVAAPFWVYMAKLITGG